MGRRVRDYEKIIEEAKASHLPYESWERLPGETGAAFAAFCAYRDYGLERNIRKYGMVFRMRFTKYPLRSVKTATGSSMKLF